MRSAVAKAPRLLLQLVAVLVAAACAEKGTTTPELAVVETTPNPIAVVSAAPAGTDREGLLSPKRSVRKQELLAAAATDSQTKPPATSEVAELRRLMGVNDAQLAEWEKQLDQTARRSRRGESAVTKRRIILAALRASSDAEYRQNIRRLRTRTATGNADDGDLSRAHVLGESTHRDSQADGFVGDMDPDVRISGPHPGPSNTAVPFQCSTTWEGVVYEDECATQEELDEANATIDALDAETQADYAEAQQTCNEVYGPEHEECRFSEDKESDFAQAGAFASAPPARHLSAPMTLASFAGLEDTDNPPCEAMNLERADGGVEVDRGSCVGDGIMAGAAVANWAFSKIAANEVLRFGASRAGRFAVVGGVMLGGFVAGYSIGTWLNCLMY